MNGSGLVRVRHSWSMPIHIFYMRVLYVNVYAIASNGSIPTKLIKYSARFAATIITKMFNASIKQAVVTNDLTIVPWNFL